MESLRLLFSQIYMGNRPTTRTMAGMVSGSRDMNSIIRVSRGSLRDTQTIVGNRSTSITIEVITASCREAAIAPVRSGYEGIAFQQSTGHQPSFTLVEKSTMA